jgi:hypothetical protein
MDLVENLFNRLPRRRNNVKLKNSQYFLIIPKNSMRAFFFFVNLYLVGFTLVKISAQSLRYIESDIFAGLPTRAGAP